MRSLNELMNSEGGLDFLRDRGIFVDAASFGRSLKPPARASLTELLGLRPDCNLVYVGQQACADYQLSTLRKFESAREVERHGATVAVLWHDMYQADAERFGTRVLLPSGSKTRGLWFVPRSIGMQEPRLIPIDPVRRQEIVKELRDWIQHAPCEDRPAARARAKIIEDIVLSGEFASLGQLNGAIASYLLREQLGFAPPTTFASIMVAEGLLTDSLNAFLANIDDVVRVFNAAVDHLISIDIDPQVKRISEDYLPLHYSCPHDGIRLRLKHERKGADHFAAATCKCQTEHRFHLGSTSPSLGELQGTARWSLDVSMPAHHNDIASGWVAGRSTALYGLVFNEIIEKVLGGRPIPALLPATLADEPEEQAHTLLVDYLIGRGPRLPKGSH